VTAISGVSGVAPTAYLAPASGTTTVSPVSESGFGQALISAVDNVSATQNQANELAVKAVTGDLTDIHDATIAATRASITLELVAAVRNKGVEAFTEIMRMQA
jgi:flagellar hook-basal body complex protein FliE